MDDILSYSKVFSPKIAKDGLLQEKEKSVLLPISLKGDNHFTLVSEGKFKDFNLDLSSMLPNGISKFYSGLFHPDIYFEIERMKKILKNTFYNHCILGFEIQEDKKVEANNKVFINYVLVDKNLFMSYEELLAFAKSLSTEVKKPIWMGLYDPKIGSVLLEDGFFLRRY